MAANPWGFELFRKILGILLVAISCTAISAAQKDATQQLARNILEELVNIKSTESGVGSAPVVQVLEKHFREAGFGGADLFTGGTDARKQNIVIRLRGRGEGRPVLLLAHLDVVEANKEDWSPDLDPFKFVERDGYFYGRGTQDVKEGASLLAANMIRWKQAGWKPSHDIIVALTADEETGNGNGVSWLLKNHRDVIDAEYCLNTDGGDFDERDGKPFVVKVAAAEKKYSAITLETRNRGGHGSLPRKDNAIYEMADALEHIAAFQFPVELSEVTRGQLLGLAKLETPERAKDMRAIVANPNDSAAAERLSDEPNYNALLRTTCVATRIEGGHAQNALPQHVKAMLNCRILPDSDPNDVIASIKKAVGDPAVTITWDTLDEKKYPSSPLRPELMKSINEVVQQMWPGVTVMPSLMLGASDGKFLRGDGIQTYGVPGTFIGENDVRAHGKDERLGVKEFYEGVDFYDKLMKDLLK
jgi:acetylornithine deacetylase/succinyl-diaminopimelate desuccinylase-like protein